MGHFIKAAGLLLTEHLKSAAVGVRLTAVNLSPRHDDAAPVPDLNGSASTARIVISYYRPVVYVKTAALNQCGRPTAVSVRTPVILQDCSPVKIDGTVFISANQGTSGTDTSVTGAPSQNLVIASIPDCTAVQGQTAALPSFVSYLQGSVYTKHIPIRRRSFQRMVSVAFQRDHASCRHSDGSCHLNVRSDGKGTASRCAFHRTL